MKKLLTLQLIVLFLCAHIMAADAQDSAAKARNVKTYPKTPAYFKPKHPFTKSIGPVIHPSDTANAGAIKPADVPSDKSLNGQYQYLLSKVYYYQQPLVGAFHKSIMDTLAQAKTALKTAEGKLSVQTKTIDSLNNSIKTNDESLSAESARVGTIDVFGISVAKTTYNLAMWGLVVLFGVIAIVVIARSGSYSREARYRVQLYNELEEEYKNYKAKANEKEKKLARELQTERNKLDDLLGNS